MVRYHVIQPCTGVFTTEQVAAVGIYRSPSDPERAQASHSQRPQRLHTSLGEAVVLDLARNLPFSFGSNYPEFPDGCLAAQLSSLNTRRSRFGSQMS